MVIKDTILIVDDSPLYREMLKAIVEKEGYKADLCSNGHEALIRIREISDSTLAVILDLYMPELDGISVLGNVRHHFPDLPAIVLSGSDDSDDEVAARKLGARSYLHKNLKIEQLQAAISELMSELRKAA
jgi:DNA-binding response OmpR family regulator